MGCYSTQTQSYKMEPYQPVYCYWDRNIQYSSDEVDNTVVSVGFNSYFNNEFILSLNIENHTDSTLLFDPHHIYAVPYINDTLPESNPVYYPLEPKIVMENLNKKIAGERGKIFGNIVLGIFVEAVAITAEEAIFDSEKPSVLAAETVRIGNDISQICIQEANFNAIDNIDEYKYMREYFSQAIIRKSVIESGSSLYGHIHLKVPRAPQYRLYVPINDRVFRFAFVLK